MSGRLAQRRAGDAAARGRWARGAWLGAVVAAGTACDPRAGEGAPADPLGATASADARGRFVWRERGTGVDFVHRMCGSGKKLLVEITGAGASLLDYDGDGDQDLLLCQGAALPGFDATGVDLRDRLYRNDGGWRFTDVTEATGAFDAGYTYSIACPDVDGDGDPDLYFVNAGRNTWLRNDVATHGRFVDVTADWGAESPEWSASAAFADLDLDGDLDLYVANYVELRLDHPGCGKLARGEAWRRYCHPDEFRPAPDRLYRNDDGRFVDVSERLGEAGKGGAGLGVVLSDYDTDGDVDLFVANDSTPNFLWRNDGGFRFAEVAGEAWVAVDGSGVSTAAMGCDFGDIDGDGDFDLVVANLAMEVNTLYRNDGEGHFDDRSAASGFGPPSLLYVGFGLELFDADLDADLDAMVANGHISDNIHLYDPSQTFRQPPLFLTNDGSGRFKNARPEEAGRYFEAQHVARALVVGDLDGDGDQDVVIAHWDGAPALLENRTIATPSAGEAAAPRWIALELIGQGKNRQALGAHVTVVAGGKTQIEEVRGTSSYGAFQALPLVFGLGAAAQVDRISVRWPDGRTSDHGPLPADARHRITQPAP